MHGGSGWPRGANIEEPGNRGQYTQIPIPGARGSHLRTGTGSTVRSGRFAPSRTVEPVPGVAIFERAVADHNCDYCYACYTGNYPTELVNIEELMAKRGERH